MARVAGTALELVKAGREHKDAELALKQLECRVHQLSTTNAHEANKQRLLEEAAQRHEEVKRQKLLGKKELERQHEERLRAVKELHDAEENRRRQLRQSMCKVFADKIEEVVSVKHKWQSSLQAHHADETKWAEHVRENSQQERRLAHDRRSKMIEEMQGSKARIREEVLKTSQSLKAIRAGTSADEESLRARAKEQREQSRMALRAAREAIESRNTQQRVELVGALTKTRAQEVSRIRKRMEELEAERQRLQSSRGRASV